MVIKRIVLLLIWAIMYNSASCQEKDELIIDSVKTGHSLLFIDFPVLLNGMEIDEEGFEMLLESKIHFEYDLSIDTLNDDGCRRYNYKGILLNTKALLFVDGELIKVPNTLGVSQKECKFSIKKIINSKEGKIQFGNDGKNGVIYIVKTKDEIDN